MLRRKRAVRKVQEPYLPGDPEGLFNASQQVETFFMEGMGLDLSSPQALVAPIEFLTRDYGLKVMTALQGWVEHPSLSVLDGEDQEEAMRQHFPRLVQHFRDAHEFSAGAALQLATLARLVLTNDAKEALLEGLSLANRKAMRHVKSFRAHNRSVSETKEKAARKRAVKAKRRA